MAMTPRILLLSAAGIVLYLVLSLYHGHQLSKYPAAGGNDGRLTVRTQEKNWVQVSTTEQIVGPEQAHEAPAGQAILPDAARESPTLAARGRGYEKESELLVRLATLQAELDRERTEKERALARELRENDSPSRKEQTAQLAEIDRLRTELQEARTRMLVAEEELVQARLKAEAMLRFGQEQNRLLAPARQEAELLSVRLQETSTKLREAQQQVSTLRTEVNALRTGQSQAAGEQNLSSKAAPAPAD